MGIKRQKGHRQGSEKVVSQEAWAELDIRLNEKLTEHGKRALRHLQSLEINGIDTNFIETNNDTIIRFVKDYRTMAWAEARKFLLEILLVRTFNEAGQNTKLNLIGQRVGSNQRTAIFTLHIERLINIKRWISEGIT